MTNIRWHLIFIFAKFNSETDVSNSLFTSIQDLVTYLLTLYPIKEIYVQKISWLLYKLSLNLIFHRCWKAIQPLLHSYSTVVVVVVA